MKILCWASRPPPLRSDTLMLQKFITSVTSKRTYITVLLSVAYTEIHLNACLFVCLSVYMYVCLWMAVFLRVKLYISQCHSNRKANMFCLLIFFSFCFLVSLFCFHSFYSSFIQVCVCVLLFFFCSSLFEKFRQTKFCGKFEQL